MASPSLGTHTHVLVRLDFAVLKRPHTRAHVENRLCCKPTSNHQSIHSICYTPHSLCTEIWYGLLFHFSIHVEFFAQIQPYAVVVIIVVVAYDGQRIRFGSVINHDFFVWSSTKWRWSASMFDDSKITKINKTKQTEREGERVSQHVRTSNRYARS